MWNTLPKVTQLVSAKAKKNPFSELNLEESLTFISLTLNSASSVFPTALILGLSLRQRM